MCFFYSMLPVGLYVLTFKIHVASLAFKKGLISDKTKHVITFSLDIEL